VAPQRAATVPPAPASNLRVVGKTSSTVTLAWDASPGDDPGGEGQLGYWVRASNGATHGTPATTHTMAGFTPGTYHEVTISFP
jgi:hypothetical protein